MDYLNQHTTSITKLQELELKITAINSKLFDISEDIIMINEYTDLESVSDREKNIHNSVNNMINKYENHLDDIKDIITFINYIKVTIIAYFIFSIISLYFKS
tara:strand:- start:908 stop:1213 length:306 start_codon:yes stop_codon:yes gene_type:complete